MGTAIPKKEDHPALHEPEMVLVSCDPDMRLGTSEVCAILGISSEMLKHYKKRGWLEPASGGGKGNYCYWRLGDVVEARRRAIEQYKAGKANGCTVRWKDHAPSNMPHVRQARKTQSQGRLQKTREVFLMSASSSRGLQHRSLADQYRLGDSETQRLIRLLNRSV